MMTDARIYRFARSGNDLERIQNAQRIWDEAQHPQGTLAEIYLREHRKLELADDLAGTVLRFHQECPWRDENSGRTIAIPALIAPFRSFHDDEITGVYCIGLNPDGSKSDRSLLGTVRDAAVKLDPLGRKTLWIGDSLEATLAGRQIRFKPAWALGSFGAIAFFPLDRRLEGFRNLRRGWRGIQARNQDLQQAMARCWSSGRLFDASERAQRREPHVAEGHEAMKTDAVELGC